MAVQGLAGCLAGPLGCAAGIGLAGATTYYGHKAMSGGGNVIPFPGTGSSSSTGEQCPPADPDDPSDCELWYNDLNLRLTQLHFNHTKRPMNDIELAVRRYPLLSSGLV